MITQDVLIRDERDDDDSTISEVTVAAFETLEISNHTEQFIIETLRTAGALSVSLVAEVDGGGATRAIVGTISRRGRCDGRSCVSKIIARREEESPARNDRRTGQE